MTTAERIVETACDTVEDLWARLSPAGGQFDQNGCGFIFRGQRESEWLLVPKIFRSSVIDRYKRGMMKPQKDHIGQWVFEWALLNSFLTSCDSAGLSVPGDSMEFRAYFALGRISNIHGINARDWPQDDVVPLMALAQHHGVPTRLLDWSDSPYVACYHAAESAIREDIDGVGRLAIFALEHTGIHPNTPLKQVRVPGNTSPNIAFQRGSFILVSNSGFRGEEFTPEVSLESRLPVGPKPILHKLTLPKSLVPDLLVRCHKFGISGASVFPGYDGSARAALEFWLAENRLAEV